MPGSIEHNEDGIEEPLSLIAGGNVGGDDICLAVVTLSALLCLKREALGGRGGEELQRRRETSSKIKRR
ncbi:hypothetical protein NL676_030821 [Syzygium grande]|nr:hypothetical protein NL676_030821 [Syzygium grande]